ncbi:MAG: FAD-dependent oxidoreductase [Ignisphaera sp.]
MNIVVIGGGAAGASAAVRAKRLNPNANVILIEATDMVTHGPCAIPYYVEGIVKNRSSLTTYTPQYLEEKRGVKVYINTKAIGIDIDKKSVRIERKGNIENIRWDKLIIATGATPITIPGSDLKNVVTVRHPAYADHVKNVIMNARKIAIIGGSYLGIEMAEAALFLGKKVLMFEKEQQILADALDSDLAKVVEEELISSGVELHLSEPVLELSGSDRIEKVVTEYGSYDVDAVVLAIGVRPQIEIVKDVGIRFGVKGSISVNEYMETSIEDIYAAGDVAEKYHRVLKKKVWIPLAPTANKEGQVAGANAALGRTLVFRGVVGTAVTKFFDLYIGRTGVTEKEAKENGIDFRAKTISVRTKAHYYPGSVEIKMKMIVDRNNTIIGVQAVGKDISVAHYIDVAAVAIEKNMTIDDLFFSDLGYMPATAPVWHPLIVAARVLSDGRF